MSRKASKDINKKNKLLQFSNNSELEELERETFGYNNLDIYSIYVKRLFFEPPQSKLPNGLKAKKTSSCLSAIGQIYVKDKDHFVKSKEHIEQLKKNQKNAVIKNNKVPEYINLPQFKVRKINQIGSEYSSPSKPLAQEIVYEGMCNFYPRHSSFENSVEKDLIKLPNASKQSVINQARISMPGGFLWASDKLPNTEITQPVSIKSTSPVLKKVKCRQNASSDWGNQGCLIFSKRVLSFNSCDLHIKNYLLQNYNIIENKTKDSKYYDIKWTFLDSEEDYKFFREDQYFNHFQNNRQITTKTLLTKNLKKKLRDKADQFYPKCFDLGLVHELNQFKSYFEQNLYACLIKKLAHYFKMRRPELYNNMKINLYEKKPNYFKFSKKNSIFYSSCVLFTQETDSSFLINFYALSTFMPYLKNMFSKIVDPNENLKLAEIENMPTHAKNMILKYAKLPSIVSEINIDILSSISDINHWKTPNNKCLQFILKSHLFLKHYLPCYNVEGIENLWIVKPGEHSKGFGILISNNIEEISTKCSQISARIVQKYIEKPLTLSLPQSNLKDIKFDLRQWVLIKSIKPLDAFIFSEPYARLCSKNYDIKNFKNNLSHLSNYSINKKEFTKLNLTNFSVLQLKQIKDYIKAKTTKSWDLDIFPSICEIVVQSLLACSSDMIQRKNCFELFGYDILLDKNGKPWLLEVNLSPACTERGEFLPTMLQEMAKGLFKVVLPKEFLTVKTEKKENDPSVCCEERQEYKWISLQNIIDKCASKK